MAGSSIIHAGATTAIAFGTTTYLGVATSNTSANTTETNRKTRFRHATTLKNLCVNCISNSLDGSDVITVRKNGADTSITVTIGAAATGFFEDTSNTASISSGDDVNIKIVTGGTTGTHSCTVYALQSNCASGTTSVFAGWQQSFGTASTTNYTALTRIAYTGTESAVQTRFRTAGTLKNLQVYSDFNPRTSSTTIKTRKNAADGNVSVSIGAGATGNFEDTSNSDSISVGDDACMAIATGTGTGSINTIIIKTEFLTTDNTAMLSSAHTTFSQNFNTTSYSPLGGLFTTAGVESQEQWKAERSFKFTQLAVVVSANTIATSATTFKLRKNAADANLNLSIGAGTTGVFVDTSSTDTCVATDKLTYRSVTPNTSGAITWNNSSLLISNGDINTKTFTVDALLKQTSSKTFTLDAWLKKTLSKSFSLDSYLKKTLTKTWSADSFLLKSQLKTFTLDAYLKKTLTKQFTTDAFLKKTQSKTFAADAFLKATLTKSFDADAYLKATLSKTFSLDAVLESEIVTPVNPQALGGGEEQRRRIYQELIYSERVVLKVKGQILRSELAYPVFFAKIATKSAASLKVQGKTPPLLRLHGLSTLKTEAGIARTERIRVFLPRSSEKIVINAVGKVDYLSRAPMDVLYLLDIIDLL